MLQRFVLSLLLLSVAPGFAQPLTIGALPEAEDPRAVVREYAAQLRTVIPELQQQLKADDAAARQFDAYLRRMRNDATAQRTVLALGSVRPPALDRAARDWAAWESVAREHAATVAELGENTARAQQEEEDRWTLLGDEANGDLAASLGDSFREAQTLHERKLTLLTHRANLATRGAKDANAAIQLSTEIEAAIAGTAERLRRRFVWTRTSWEDLPGMLTDVRADAELVVAPFTELSLAEWNQQAIDVARANAVGVTTALLLALLLAWRRRVVTRYLRHAVGRLPWGRGLLRRVATAAGTALGRSWLTGLVAALAVALRLGLSNGARAWSELLVGVAVAVFAWRFGYTLVSALFNPKHPTRRLAAVDDAVAAMLRRRMHLFIDWLALAGIGTVLVQRVGLTSAPLILAAIMIELLGLRSLYSTLRHDRVASTGMPALAATWAQWWRSVTRFAAVVMIGLCGLGLLNLAWFVGWAMLKSTVILALALLVWRVGREAIAEWAANLNARALRSLIGAWDLLLLAGALFILGAAWQIDALVVDGLRQALTAGIEVNGQHVSILRVAIAAACIAVAWLVGRVAAAALESRVFPHTPFDTGIRTAIVRSAHYVLMTAGFLAAVHTMGFDLTNLAIVAGALGVGIGLGLQSLVSNFVSGLVILFERPFTLGDMLEHEGVFGYVRKIRARSTVIHTLDRAEIILPNAELLTHKITNWTLSDSRARVALSVGVAYGSDVNQVREALWRVGKANSRVLEEPEVYFTAFGDNALQFTLMVRIDIRERMPVLSELHFAVDAAFRELGIQIPFPQREVHISTPEVMGPK